MLWKCAVSHAAGPSPGLESLSTQRVRTAAEAGAASAPSTSALKDSAIPARAMTDRIMIPPTLLDANGRALAMLGRRGLDRVVLLYRWNGLGLAQPNRRGRAPLSAGLTSRRRSGRPDTNTRGEAVNLASVS